MTIAQKTKKVLLAVFSFLLVVVSIGYLMATSFSGSMVYYKTVEELLDNPDKYDKRPIRINGTLQKNSILKKPGTSQYVFHLEKNKKSLKVSYSGILPDSVYGKEKEIIVHGAYDKNQKTFNASKILTKCPSKHEARAKAK